MKYGRKLFSNRKGIELSINFIVMLVLATVVFIGGIAFATKFFGHAETVRSSLDSETERQIERLLDSGSPVVLPISNREIFRKKHDTFGLGVFAMYNGDYTAHIDSRSAFDKQKKEMSNDLEIQISPASLELEKNEKGKFLILVQVPKDAKSGTYIFTIRVSFGGEPDVMEMLPQYDNPVQLIVRVP
jgi:hypothetical protein